MTILLSYFLVALTFSFLCSAMEAVLLSVSPSYIAGLEEEHPKTATTLRKLKLDIDRPLAAILTMNTAANTVGAVGVGAAAQGLYDSMFLTLITAIVTLLILFVGEILPKTLGAIYWRQLAIPAAHILPILIIILYPLVSVAQMITRTIKRGTRDTAISRDEYAALAKLGVRQGVFADSEARVLINLFKLGELTAHDVMTPRTVVSALDEETTVQEAVAEKNAMLFSRIPIWRGSVDHITGYVLKTQLLIEFAQGNPQRQIKELGRQVLIVPSGLSLLFLLERLLNESEHFGVVVDEFGGSEGVVTMEDILETLLGMEIVDEKDSVQNLRAMARERWKVRRKALGTASNPQGE